LKAGYAHALELERTPRVEVLVTGHARKEVARPHD
jgi:hypothetical protein